MVVDGLSTVDREDSEGPLPCLWPRAVALLRSRPDGVWFIKFRSVICDHESADELVELVRDTIASETHTTTHVDEQGRDVPALFWLPIVQAWPPWPSRLRQVVIDVYTSGRWRPQMHRPHGDGVPRLLLDDKLTRSFPRCGRTECSGKAAWQRVAHSIWIPDSLCALQAAVEPYVADGMGGVECTVFSSVKDEMKRRLAEEERDDDPSWRAEAVTRFTRHSKGV